jgi:hypothetical protein
VKLGPKLRIGFAIPVLMLLASGVWSYIRFDALSRGVDTMLRENDRSIRAANEMILGLERMDSGALLRVAGHASEATRIIVGADSGLTAAIEFAGGNVTNEAEPAILDSIHLAVGAFRTAVEALELDPSLESYLSDVYPAFLDAHRAMRSLRRVNEVEMESRASHIGRQAVRASLPSVVLATAAVLFTLLFAWFVRIFVVWPLRRILNGARGFVEKGEYQGGGVSTGDELQELDQVLSQACYGRERPAPPQ